MKSLSMRAESPHSNTPDSPPKIVLKNEFGLGTEPGLDAETTIDYLNCSWWNKDHLQVLYEDKDGSLSTTEFAAMDLGDQLHEVIDIHTPSELKMVYAQICSKLSMKPSTIFFKTAKKGKASLVEIILANLKRLKKIDDK